MEYGKPSALKVSGLIHKDPNKTTNVWENIRNSQTISVCAERVEDVLPARLSNQGSSGLLDGADDGKGGHVIGGQPSR